MKRGATDVRDRGPRGHFIQSSGAILKTPAFVLNETGSQWSVGQRRDTV